MGLPAHDAVFNFFNYKSQIFKVSMPIFNLWSSKLTNLCILEENLQS